MKFNIRDYKQKIFTARIPNNGKIEYKNIPVYAHTIRDNNKKIALEHIIMYRIYEHFYIAYDHSCRYQTHSEGEAIVYTKEIIEII
jgi:hypothetical protein